jgi:hypothetical protein
LMQFQNVIWFSLGSFQAIVLTPFFFFKFCTEKPEQLPPIEEIFSFSSEDRTQSKTPSQGSQVSSPFALWIWYWKSHCCWGKKNWQSGKAFKDKR